MAPKGKRRSEHLNKERKAIRAAARTNSAKSLSNGWNRIGFILHKSTTLSRRDVLLASVALAIFLLSLVRLSLRQLSDVTNQEEQSRVANVVA
jgi:hypothetical protein